MTAHGTHVPRRVLAWQALALLVALVGCGRSAAAPPLHELPAAVDWDALDLPTARYHGRLVDEQGQPVVGAQVWVLPNGRVRQAAGLPAELYCGEVGFGVAPPRRVPVPSRLLPTTTTAADGSFALHAPWASMHTTPNAVALSWGHPQAGLIVAAPGLATLGLRLEAPVDSAVDVGKRVLRPGRTLAGRVLDADGEPLAGARVDVSEVHEESDQGLMAWFECQLRLSDLHGTTTDAEGRYRLAGLWPADQNVAVVAPGHQRGEVRSVPADDDERALSVPTLQLLRGASLTGRVLDDAGRPVADALVFSVASSQVRREAGRLCEVTALTAAHDALPVEMTAIGDDWVRAPAVRTDERGAFVLDGLPPGRSQRLYVRHPDHEPLRLTDVVPGETPPQELTLAPASRWELELVAAEDGAPLEASWVAAWRITGSGDDPPLWVRPGDGPGRVTVSGAGPLGTRLLIEADGRAPSVVELPGLAVGEVSPRRLKLVPGAVVGGR